MYKIFGRKKNREPHQKAKSNTVFRSKKKLDASTVGNLKIPIPMLLYDIKCADMTESEILAALTSSGYYKAKSTGLETARDSNHVFDHSMRVKDILARTPRDTEQIRNFSMQHPNITVSNEKEELEENTAERAALKEEKIIVNELSQLAQSKGGQEAVEKVNQQFTIAAIPSNYYVDESLTQTVPMQPLTETVEEGILTSIRDALYTLHQQYIQDRRDKSTRLLEETMKELEMMIEIQETQQLLRQLLNRCSMSSNEVR
ncbi:hypothetical protein BDF20DRAFT_990367 [Mycotypha africana]|uniref:uncharacterized protein n=1 Tax=Mycotypha africana TaxID=64632 RepID=UPI0023014D8E|nr:uncharacterized protein BDF20DRAFT_990367 [Mycotypha africana]KAI8970046.1 hypothetical protein BDF20DRAFT_990367 [Mycotypha africana]